MVTGTQLELTANILQVALQNSSAQVCSQIFEAGENPKTVIATKPCFITVNHIGAISKKLPSESGMYPMPMLGTWDEKPKNGIITGGNISYEIAGTWIKIHPFVRMCAPPDKYLITAKQLLTAITVPESRYGMFICRDRGIFLFHCSHNKPEALWLSTINDVEPIAGMIPPGLVTLLEMAVAEDPESMVGVTAVGGVVMVHVNISSKHIVASWMCLNSTDRQGPWCIGVGHKFYSFNINKHTFSNFKEEKELIQFGTLQLDAIKRPLEQESTAPVKEQPVATPAVDTSKQAQEQAIATVKQQEAEAVQVVEAVVEDAVAVSSEPPVTVEVPEPPKVEDAPVVVAVTTDVAAQNTQNPETVLSIPDQLGVLAADMNMTAELFKTEINNIRQRSKQLKAIEKELRKQEKKPKQSDLDTIADLKAEVTKLKKMLAAAAGL